MLLIGKPDCQEKIVAEGLSAKEAGREGESMIDYWMRHFAISVADMDETIEWYDRVLGFKPISREHLKGPRCEMATLSNGSLEIEVFLHDETIPIPPERTSTATDPQTQGMKHVCFGCDDLDAVINHLNECGVKIIMGPVSMGDKRLLYINDNTGNLLEFMQ